MSKEARSVIVLGAGVAGMAAATELARGGSSVVVLEARERVGGRIHTISAGGRVRIELGAEFVHGGRNAAWEMIRAAKLATQKVPDKHWTPSGAGLIRQRDFWKNIQEATARFNPAAPDQDFQSFLDQAWSLSDAAKAGSKQYVENFHAAPAGRVSVHALAASERSAEQEQGTENFRIKAGYSELVRWQAKEIQGRGVQIYLNAMAHTFKWQPGRVTVGASTSEGPQWFEAERAIVALPLGVLKAQEGAGALVFDPALPGYCAKAFESLAVGAVVKVTFQFSSRFWRMRNFGFIHAEEASLPTWWADPRGPVLTGWAGGPKAEQLSGVDHQAIVTDAIGTLSALFGVEGGRIRELLVATFSHDWMADPFTRGAYSYTPVRMRRMQKLLAMPVADTIFFAGEATDSEGDQGTVHGAISTGLRAAKQVAGSFRKPIGTRLQLQHQA